MLPLIVITQKHEDEFERVFERFIRRCSIFVSGTLDLMLRLKRLRGILITPLKLLFSDSPWKYENNLTTFKYPGGWPGKVLE